MTEQELEERISEYIQRNQDEIRAALDAIGKCSVNKNKDGDSH